MFEELGIPAPAIEDHGMIVIAERTRQHHLDLAPLRCLDQTVRERVVRVGVRPQQELALCAATGDQIELTGDTLSGLSDFRTITGQGGLPSHQPCGLSGRGLPPGNLGPDLPNLRPASPSIVKWTSSPSAIIEGRGSLAFWYQPKPAMTGRA
jgi:hypothetical protein